MFKLHRHNRQAKSGEGVDFKFSNFQAIQVPNGWDKLFVSVISVETGKTIAKSSKSPVRNGNCQWTETFSESIWSSKDDSLKELEECLLKFVVATGSARSGILGEATINMTGYMSSKASVPVFLPLKKCNYGTILQVKIQCLTPNTKLRGKESKVSTAHLEDQKADHVEVESRSYGSEDSFARKSGSCSSKELDSNSHPVELQSRHTSVSGPGSHHSFDSAEGSIGRDNFSPNYDLNGDKYSSVGRQDSVSSVNSSPHNNFIAENPSHSTHSLFNSKVSGSGNDSQWQESAKKSHFMASSSLVNSGSSKTLLEAAEDTIDELRAEAKMWERNARKAMLDMEILRKEFSDQSKKKADKDMELSAAYTECNGLKKEIEQLKVILEEALLKQTDREDLTFQSANEFHIQKELEKELKFQQESNADLTLQLKRSQESNIELVIVLQELEETIEKQKAEIENLSALQFKNTVSENSIQAVEGKSNGKENDSTLNNQILMDIETEYKLKLSAKEEEIASLEAKLADTLMNRESDDSRYTYGSEGDLIRENETLKEKLQELERDCSELTNENLELLFKLKDSKNCPPIYSSFGEPPKKPFSISEFEVSELKSKIQDLEEELKKTMIKKDQLTAFETSKLFSDLVEQLEMAFYHVKRPWYNISSHVNDDFDSDIPDLVIHTAVRQGGEDSILNSVIKLNKLLDGRIIQCEEVLKHFEIDIKRSKDEIAEAQKILEGYILKEKSLSLSIQELEGLNTDLEANLSGLEDELKEKLYEIEKLEGNLLLKEDEMGVFRGSQIKLEAQISDLNQEKIQLKEKMEILQREINSHVLTNKNLDRKCSKLESQKEELELHLNELKEGNMHLSETIASLEVQLRDLTDERESDRLEMENSKSVSMSLADEIKRLEIEIETEKMELKQKLLYMQNHMSEVQNECENLKSSNQRFQVSVDSLSVECNNLQKENELLRERESELLEHYTDLETQLRESQKISSVSVEKVEVLEENLSSVLKDFSSREKRWTSELDALHQENRSQNEKLVLTESLSNQMLLEKTTEVENLQMEIEKLKHQISMNDGDGERIASEIEELSSLRAIKAKLESTLQEVQCKVKLTENELDALRTDSESKVNGLMVELSTSRRKHESLTVNHEKTMKLLGSYRSSEEKLKTTLNDIELKLTISEYECQQLSKETSNLKVQLQMVAHLQEEIVALKAELKATKTEKEKLEASLHLASKDCEELETEKIVFLQKISTLQTAMSEFEEWETQKIASEEKLRKMKSDLLAREALYAEDANLKCEFSQIKKDNEQLQSKIQLLEEEKGSCMKKAQALEEQLKLMEERRNDRSKSRSKKGDKFDLHDESHSSGVDHTEKVQRLLSEGKSDTAAPRKSIVEGETVAKERLERSKSSLEAELRDIRERYFQMSLKYAEVEAQREGLVMKLKAAKNGNKWFS